MFGANIESFEDVKRVFINYITQAPNADGVKVTVLPWTEAETGVQPETSLISEQLVWCNENGILTVNSQPSVNGAPSTDPLVGWGKPGGYCYQKAYLECFMTAELSDKLIQIIEREFPVRVNYHAINKDVCLKSNFKNHKINSSSEYLRQDQQRRNHSDCSYLGSIPRI